MGVCACGPRFVHNIPRDSRATDLACVYGGHLHCHGAGGSYNIDKVPTVYTTVIQLQVVYSLACLEKRCSGIARQSRGG